MGSLCGEYVFMRPSETSLKTYHGANYLHEPPSGPAFGIRDANVANFINSYDFCEVSQTHEDIVSLAVDFIDVAVETPMFPV